MDEPPSFIAWKATLTVLYAIGFLSYMSRIVYCWKSQTFQRRDWLAIFIAILAPMLAVVIWPAYQEEVVYTDISNQTVLYWAMASLRLAAVWYTRISLALSMGAVGNRHVHNRTATKLALLFFAFFVTCLVWLVTTGCVHSSRLSSTVRTVAYCNDNTQAFMIGYFTLTILGNLALLALFLTLCLNCSQVNLRDFVPVGLSSIIMSFGTFLHAAYYYAPSVKGSSGSGLIVIDVMGHLEASISMLLATMPLAVESWSQRSLMRANNEPKATNSHVLDFHIDRRVSSEKWGDEDDSSSVASVKTQDSPAVCHAASGIP